MSDAKRITYTTTGSSEEFHHECLADPTRGIGFLPTKTSEHLCGQLDFKAFFRHGMAPFVYMSRDFCPHKLCVGERGDLSTGVPNIESSRHRT